MFKFEEWFPFKCEKISNDDKNHAKAKMCDFKIKRAMKTNRFKFFLLRTENRTIISYYEASKHCCLFLEKNRIQGVWIVLKHQMFFYVKMVEI